MNEKIPREKPIQVFLVDDHPSTLAGLRVCLDGPDFEIAGTAMTGKEAVAGILAQDPDAVILDVRLPDFSGLEVLKKVKAGAPQVAVLMFTAFPEPGFLMDAVMGGAAGFLLKGVGANEVTTAIRRLADGENTLPPEVWKPMLREFQSRQIKERGASAEGWDEIDLTLLQGMALGWSNSKIASNLGKSYDTVRSRNKRIFSKLGTSDRTQAVVKAIARGLITAVDAEE